MNSFQRAIANLFKIPVPTEKPGRGYGIRKYAGASQSQTSLTDWQSWMTSADNEISSSLRLLISRSRQLYQDDSNVQTAIDELVGTVVGEGINLQSKVKNTKGELNIKVNQEIEDKFNTWAQNREWCDVAGRLTFWQMQAVIQHSVLVDGGILVRVVNKRFGRSPLPFALELIEIDQLDDRLQFWRTANGNEIRMGVEVDQWKRTAAYWILDSHPGDYYRTGLGSLQSRRVPASEILHIFNRQGWRPGQTRGVPQIHAGIIKARHLLGLEESEIVRSRVQSCISAFIENEMPDFEPDVDEYGNAVKDLYPGAIEYLQPGQKLAPFDPSSPNPNLGDFVKHFQRSIAGIFGLSSHTVTRDLSDANYSSLREGKLNEWKSISLYRDQLSEDFNSPVFRRWLDFAVMSGFVKMPKNYESEKESKYYRDYWFGSPMAWVDPAKEMIAKEKEIALGLTTRSRVLAEVGIDFEEILQEKEKEKRLMEQYDVSFGEDDLNPPADGEQPDDGEPAPLVEGMQAVRDTAIAAIRAVTDIQTRTVETVPVQAVPVVEQATEPEEEEPVEININMADYLPEPEPTDVGEVYPLLPGMTRAVSVDGERKLKKKKKKNCTNGQVCGFSCISKTKTCVANMTTAQLKEHNKAKRLAAAEKRKAAKAAKAGGVQPISSLRTHQEAIERGKAIAGTYLEQIRPIGERMKQLNDENRRLIEEYKRVRQEEKTFWENARLGSKEPYDFDKKAQSLIQRSESVLAEFDELKRQPDALAEQALKAIKKRSGVSAIDAKKTAENINMDESLDRPGYRKDKNGNNIGEPYYHGKQGLIADAKDFYRLTGGKGQIDELIYSHDRAYALKGQKEVNIGTPASSDIRRTLFHELGHHVEYQDKNAQRIAGEWVQSRAEGPPVKLNKLVPNSNYDDSEIAVPDKFSDPYVGKVYDNGWSSTEVLSMGLERWSSPKSLSNHFIQDPDHAYLVIGLVAE